MKIKHYLIVSAILLTSSLSAFAANTVKPNKIPGATVQDAAFFTGKPYDADLESYVFNYRNYSAEAGRWTTSDPSGFPNGANNRIYTGNTPVSTIDSNGLFYSGTFYTGSLVDRPEWITAKEAVAGPMTKTSMEHADGTTPGNWSLNTTDTDTIRGCSEYNTFKNDIVNLLTLQYSGAAAGSSSWNTGPRHYEFNSNTDVHNAIGGLDFFTSGTVTVDSSGNPTYVATVTLYDWYTFAQYGSATGLTNPLRLGYDLQSHGYIRPFATNGSWAETFE